MNRYPFDTPFSVIWRGCHNIHPLIQVENKLRDLSKLVAPVAVGRDNDVSTGQGETSSDCGPHATVVPMARDVRPKSRITIQNEGIGDRRAGPIGAAIVHEDHFDLVEGSELLEDRQHLPLDPAHISNFIEQRYYDG